MTDQEINMSVAKCLGWENIIANSSGDMIGTAPFDATMDDRQVKMPIPNYVGDLNAMHEVEKTLTDEEYIQWCYSLTKLRNDTCADVCRCHSATARQRAEAFLRVKGLWKEGQSV